MSSIDQKLIDNFFKAIQNGEVIRSKITAKYLKYHNCNLNIKFVKFLLSKQFWLPSSKHRAIRSASFTSFFNIKDLIKKWESLSNTSRLTYLIKFEDENKQDNNIYKVKGVKVVLAKVDGCFKFGRYKKFTGELKGKFIYSDNFNKKIRANTRTVRYSIT